MSADPPRTLQVACGDGAVMAIPNPMADPPIEWCMRYGDANEGRFVAASLLAAYDYLLSAHIPMTEATRRLRLMRKARREALSRATS